MEHHIRSIRPFIGSKDFDISRGFYRDLGFEEIILTTDMSVFKTGNTAFYLQKAYVQDWIDNTMVFLEVDNVERYWNQLSALNLTDTYQNVRLTPIKVYEWGKECFLHDPCGILWHFGEFFKL